MEVIDSDKAQEENKWIRISAWAILIILLIAYSLIGYKISIDKTLLINSLLPRYTVFYTNGHFINFGIVSSFGTIFGFISLLIRKNLFALTVQVLLFVLAIALMHRIELYELFIPD